MQGIKVIYSGGTGEYVEKKSRFIAGVMPAETEEEAVGFIERCKKRYYDASHNCHAYVIGMKNEVARCSDDGEPAGTAGRPMLEILLSEGIHNVVAVVTRYFGGTLLGRGGLVRAYQAALKEGLDNSVVMTKMPATIYTVITDYNGIDKLRRLVRILDVEYTDVVRARVLMTSDDEESIIDKIQESTNGKSTITKDTEVLYAAMGNDIRIFT